MEELEQEKEMVREMRKKGMKLAEIALECNKSIAWVYSRLDGKYSPGQKSEEKVEIEEEQKLENSGLSLQEQLDQVEQELAAVREGKEKLMKMIGHSPFRTDEELVEYRKKRDAEAENPD